MYYSLIRRFSPGILPRWEKLAFHATLSAADKRARVPRVSVYTGDLLLAIHMDHISDIDANAVNLYYVDSRKKIKSAEIPDSFCDSSWLSAWGNADAEQILDVVAETKSPLVTLAACACARTALKYTNTAENVVRTAIEAAEAWARGLGNKKQATEAAKRADQTGESYTYRCSAVYAAYAAGAIFSSPSDAAAHAATAIKLTESVPTLTSLASMGHLVREIIPIHFAMEHYSNMLRGHLMR